MRQAVHLSSRRYLRAVGRKSNQMRARNVSASTQRQAQVLARRAVAGFWGKGVFQCCDRNGMLLSLTSLP